MELPVDINASLRRGHGFLPWLVTLTKLSSHEETRIHPKCEQKVEISSGEKSNCWLGRMALRGKVK